MDSVKKKKISQSSRLSNVLSQARYHETEEKKVTYVKKKLGDALLGRASSCSLLSEILE